jgi:undecaprenyl-phosphate 4-deoxy-4-formamido-L-arabinose transferase
MSVDSQMSPRHPGDAPKPLPGLSVVVPVYRSETILPELARRLAEVLPTLTEHYELVLVNDSSPDGSWDVISRLASQHPWIHAINLMRNYGQHNALLCGIRAAQYAILVTMDDDLQHPPEEIPKLLTVLDQMVLSPARMAVHVEIDGRVSGVITRSVIEPHLPQAGMGW